MQIDPNARAKYLEGISLRNTPETHPSGRETETLADFHDAESLNLAIQDLEEVRAEKIERALNLIGQVKWPPGETIRRIAHLLAAKMERPED